MIRLSAAVAFIALALSLAPAHAQTGPLANPATASERAPATFTAKFETSKGPVTIEVTRAWAPNGADRFYTLVKNGFFDDARFFRVVSNFMVQFGINGDPKISAVWRDANIKDDAVKQSNERGMMTFATAGPDTRTTQVFINFGDNAGLDGQGFSPFGKVISGMDVVDSLFAGYGEGSPSGHGPNQGIVQSLGNPYLAKAFPKLDYIKTATIEK